MRRELMVILLVLLAGCSGLNGGTPSTQPTETTAPDPTTTSNAANATPSNTINYTELSDTEQRAFDTAQQRQVGFAPDAIRESPYVNRTYFPTDAQDVFQNHKYVLKNGTYYRLTWHAGPIVATYRIEVTQQEPPGNATVVSLGNLTPRVRQPVEKAIQNGTYDTPFGKWGSLPDSLDGVDYIRDGEQYYKTHIIPGDFWGEEVRAEPVE
ncbi:DUF3558 domain-containing protein [Halobacterium sp. KA-6]|uniref:DUF3558 domain-containing protein n=1 Tax=Halobacterium sp. KA-6 TaxID=2896368 RepID=UPI001E58959D|nr:DUF3558 domain-containing protein [Halobacterium sp. KA-6]MCD2204506.1 DUF3558 domain-containing protein [Halobacterium sp. KA-6]